MYIVQRLEPGRCNIGVIIQSAQYQKISDLLYQNIKFCAPEFNLNVFSNLRSWRKVVNPAVWFGQPIDIKQPSVLLSIK